MASEQGEVELRRRVVGRFLKERREKAGLTQWDVASHLKYSTAQFISNWERGVSMPPLEALPSIAGLLRVPGRDFVKVMYQYQEQLLKLNKRQLTDIFKKRR